MYINIKYIYSCWWSSQDRDLEGLNTLLGFRRLQEQVPHKNQRPEWGLRNGLEGAVWQHIRRLGPLPWDNISSGAGASARQSYCEWSSNFQPPCPRFLALTSWLGTACWVQASKPARLLLPAARLRLPAGRWGTAQSQRRAVGAALVVGAAMAVGVVSLLAPPFPRRSFLFSLSAVPTSCKPYIKKKKKKTSVPLSPVKFAIFNGVSYCRGELTPGTCFRPHFLLLPFFGSH